MKNINETEEPKFWLGWLDFTGKNSTDAIRPGESIECLRCHMNTLNDSNDYYRINGKVVSKEDFMAAWTWFAANVPEADRRGHTAKFSQSPNPDHFLWLVNVHKRGCANGENETL